MCCNWLKKVHGQILFCTGRLADCRMKQGRCWEFGSVGAVCSIEERSKPQIDIT